MPSALDTFDAALAAGGLDRCQVRLLPEDVARSGWADDVLVDKRRLPDFAALQRGPLRMPSYGRETAAWLDDALASAHPVSATIAALSARRGSALVDACLDLTEALVDPADETPLATAVLRLDEHHGAPGDETVVRAAAKGIPIEIQRRLAPIVAAAAAKKIAVIEDAAQAIGCQYQGQPVGSWGDVGCFSFFPSKNLGGFGDGGLVTTTNAALAHRLKLIRNHGMEPKYYHHLVGANFRIDALQAAVLRVKLPYLAAWSDGRRANANRYRAMFAAAGLSQVTLPVEAPDRTHIYNQFVIGVPNRDGLRAHLDASGIGTEVYYPVPFHLQECFASLGYKPGAFPVAEAAALSSLAIPIYPELTEAHQAAVVDAIRTFYRG